MTSGFQLSQPKPNKQQDGFLPAVFGLGSCKHHDIVNQSKLVTAKMAPYGQALAMLPQTLILSVCLTKD